MRYAAVMYHDLEAECMFMLQWLRSGLEGDTHSIASIPRHPDVKTPPRQNVVTVEGHHCPPLLFAVSPTFLSSFRKNIVSVLRRVPDSNSHAAPNLSRIQR